MDLPSSPQSSTNKNKTQMLLTCLGSPTIQTSPHHSGVCLDRETNLPEAVLVHQFITTLILHVLLIDSLPTTYIHIMHMTSHCFYSSHICINTVQYYHFTNQTNYENILYKIKIPYHKYSVTKSTTNLSPFNNFYYTHSTSLFSLSFSESLLLFLFFFFLCFL